MDRRRTMAPRRRLMLLLPLALAVCAAIPASVLAGAPSGNPAASTTTSKAPVAADAPSSPSSSSASSPLPPLPPRREWQAPEYKPPFDKRSPASFLRFFFGPFLRNLHVTGPDSLIPTKVSRAGAALREAGLSPRVAGGEQGPRVVGASQTYEDFITGFVAWVQANVAPYPQPPAELRSGELMPPLLPQYEDDLAYVRSLSRGAFPDVIRGRPAALSPRATDPLQNGREASLPPGYAFTAPGNQEKGEAWRAWEAVEAAKGVKGRLFGGVKKGLGLGLGLGGGAAAAAGAPKATTGAAAPAAVVVPGEDDDKGAPWLRALIKRFDDPKEL